MRTALLSHSFVLFSCGLTASFLAGCGDGDTSPNSVAPDVATPDGATPDGATPDGATPDGATPDGTASDTTTPSAPRPFPSDFLFGTAVAGFQVDMGCPTLPASECEDPNSDWYVFVTSPETLQSAGAHLAGDPPSSGPGFWELYPEDMTRAKEELGNNALRISFEWSRIFPSATDAAGSFAELKALASPKALAGYHAQLAKLKALGMTPLVTLNHYTLPTWIHDGVACHLDLASCSPRGWVDQARTVKEIAKYAGFVAQEFGAEVDLWATENEPFAVILPGYLLPSAERTNPPARSLATAEAKTVFAALIEAHARMYDAIKAGDTVDLDGDGEPAEVGLVYAMAPVKAMDPQNPLDVEAAKNVFYLWNMAFLNAVVKGDFDAELDGSAVRREDLAGRMDWLGINFYTRITVEGLETALLPDLSPLTTFNALTLVPWEDYTRGIYEMAMIVKGFGIPAYITETGTADPDDSGKQSKWLVETLTWIHEAIGDGADVRGYFYWTLIDNYEWNHGMEIRMGLYAVDTGSVEKPRSPRSGVATYREITSAGGITAALMSAWPVAAE
ncbi:MAG: glycoside hydrolase family 1 protein [Myxococcales bacterium]|nr:glycoside hydrolase family 1 protein [Myxococcales bacterium]